MEKYRSLCDAVQFVLWYAVCCVTFASSDTKLWSNVMEILDEKDGVDTELLVYAMTLINKVSEWIPPKT